MVFVLTIRALSCREIAESDEAVKRIKQLYWDMEKASTPVNVMLPWLPTKSRKARNEATTELYLIVKKIVDDRREKGIAESDAMQSLIDAGDSVNDIVHFVLSSLFAGISELDSLHTQLVMLTILKYLCNQSTLESTPLG